MEGKNRRIHFHQQQYTNLVLEGIEKFDNHSLSLFTRVIFAQFC